MRTHKLTLILATGLLLGGCALEEVFGRVHVVVTGPELLETVRYQMVSAAEGALIAGGEEPMERGRALIRAPAVQGGAILTLEGRYGGFTYYKAELGVSEPLSYAVSLGPSNRLTASPTLVFANLPGDTSADQVVVCAREPAFAPSLGNPYCSPGYTPVVQVPVADSVLPLSDVPAVPSYEVLYLTPTRVYRGAWTSWESPIWSFDLNTMTWEAR